MAWINGNTPTGVHVKTGRILCEAMYACNEKQDAVGIAQSTWNGGAIGAKPAVNALAGLKVRTVGSTVLGELQTAITAIVARLVRPYFVDGAGAAYTLANLCTDAFGGVGFTAATTKHVTDVTMVSEILKALETLAKIEAALISFHEVATYRGNVYSSIGAGQATRALARAAVGAYQVVAPGFSGEQSGYHAGSATYDYYLIYDQYGKFEFDLPYFASVDTVIYRYGGSAIIYTYTVPNPSVRLYNISAAQYAAANVSGPQGNLVLTLSPPAGVGLKNEFLSDSSWLAAVGAGTFYYFKGTYAAGLPFPEDASSDECSISNVGFYPRYNGAWTYN